MDFLSKKLLADVVLKACLEIGLTPKVAQSVVEKTLTVLSPESIDKERIIELFKQGKSKSEVARLCGCSRTYVYKVLNEAGLIKQQKKFS